METTQHKKAERLKGWLGATKKRMGFGKQPPEKGHQVRNGLGSGVQVALQGILSRDPSF